MQYKLDPKFLNKKTETFDFTNPQIPAKELFDNMKETMLTVGGVGLAANQVGIDTSMFVLGDPKNPQSIIGCFNPKIVFFSGKTKMDNESCLSLPGILMKKERDVEIRVRYQDYLGAMNTKVFTNFTARVFQHEYDHLQGITLLTGLSKLKFDMAMKKAKKLGVKYRMEAIQNERFE